jgi:hypothetical protein
MTQYAVHADVISSYTRLFDLAHRCRLCKVALCTLLRCRQEERCFMGISSDGSYVSRDRDSSVAVVCSVIGYSVYVIAA